MPESIVLDPTELTNRGELNLTPWISFEGVNYGDAALVTYTSELAVGSTVVDARVPNRQVTIPLTIRDMGGTTFAAARSAIQAKVGIWQQQGGWIKRVTASGGTVFADVVSATLTLGGDWLQAQRDVDVNASITLETIPDFYKAEETLSDHVETTLPDITFTETTTNGGDFPLGDRVRVVVDEDQGQNQRGLIWSFRGRNYSSASTAATAYEAEALTPLDTAARAAKVGASGGTVVTHGTLATYWLPVLSTNLSAGNYLTHTGTHRVYARVFSASGTAVQARFVYDVGDLVYPTENDAVRLYDGGTFHILDLGEVRLDQPANATGYRWQGQIQAKGDAGAEAFSVDRVYVVNQDESAGVLRSPLATNTQTSGPVARDEFTQTAGNLDAPKTAQVGGNWAESTRTGVNGFQTSGSPNFNLTRTTVSDADLNSGAYAYVGSSITACRIQLDWKTQKLAGVLSTAYGILARFTDANNWFMATFEAGGSNAIVRKRVAGAVTTLATSPSMASVATDVTQRWTLTVDALGNWALYTGLATASGALLLSGNDSALATGGALASGKVGIYDAQAAATANTRTYDNFAAWVPDTDAVIFASQSVELGTQGIVREDTGGTAYGPVTSVAGDLPRMPNRSSAGTVEFFAKASRGDLQTTPDPGIDDISVRVYRRASYLTVG